MRIVEKNYVKAIFAFQGQSPKDLTLQVGEVVRVTEIVDPQWMIGQKVGQAEKGTFPANFVELLQLPSFRTGQKIFLVLQNFEADQPGDLELTKGEIILGTEKVDDSWWRGKNGPLKGIFPVSFVAELEHNDGPRSRSASARSNSLKSRANSLVDSSGSVTNVQETTFARALVDVRPQLDGELAFQVGDMIEITEVIDEDWMFGKCRNKEGLISSVCVEMLDDGDSGCESNINSSFEAKVQDRVQDLIRPGFRNSLDRPRTATGGSYTSENTRSHDAEVTPYGQVLFPFMAQLPDELSLEEGQIVNLIQHIDADWTEGEIDGRMGVFPSNFVEVIVDCPYIIPDDEVIDNDDAVAAANFENVEIENKVSPSIEPPSISDNNVHSCQTEEAKDKSPLVVNGKDDSKNSNAVDQPFAAISAGVSDVIVISANHEIGLVCHNFEASVEGDVSVKEGDTVEVTRKVDENWVEIQLESGEKGLVPVNHIEIIGSWPREDADSSTQEILMDEADCKLKQASNSKTEHQSVDLQKDVTVDKSELPSLGNAQSSSSALPSSLPHSGGVLVSQGLTVSVCSQSFSQSKPMSSVSPPATKPKSSISPSATKPKSSVSPPIPKTSSSSVSPPMPKPKPPVGPKPVIAPKPLVIKPAHFYAAKPFSSRSSSTSHVVSPTEKQQIVLKSLDSLIEGEITKAKSRSSSDNSDSSSEHRGSFTESQQSNVISNNVLQSNTALTKPRGYVPMTQPSGDKLSSSQEVSQNSSSVKKEDLATFDPIASQPTSCPPIDAQPKRPVLTPALSLQDNYAKSKSQTEGKRASITVMNTNVPLPDLIPSDASPVKPDNQAAVSCTEKDSSFVNQAFVMDVAEGNLLGDVTNTKDTSSAAVSKRAKVRPPRPKSAIFPSSSSSQSSSMSLPPSAAASLVKAKSPPPRPMGPRLAAAPAKAPLVPERVDNNSSQPKPKPVPQRPAPKAPMSNKPEATSAAAAGTQALEGRRVPVRKAPPRPVTVSVVAGSQQVPSRPTDLMQFSPEKPVEDDDDVTMAMLADLKVSIEEKTTEIKKYEGSRDDLHNSLGQEGLTEAKQKELQDSLMFVESVLQALREEQLKLKGNLLSIGGSEERNERSRLLNAQRAEEEKRRKEEQIQREVEQRVKRREHRTMVINEIMDTEKGYLFSLNMCLETFLDADKPPPAGVDIDFLLGNTEEIADVSQKLLLNLESSVTGKSFDDQCIAEDMKNTYAPYCRNHDAVIKVLESYGDNEDITEFMNQKVEAMKEHMNLFDVSSLLIKPVQRILKYPLLLNELLQNTEENHPDKQAIAAAIKAMTDVAKAINEYKRRKDLVYKYKKSSVEGFSDKIAKLNLHSIKKKSSRIRGRLSTNLGLGNQLKDENFEREEAKFRSLEKAVKTFLSSAVKYLEQSQEAMRCQENLVDGIVEFYDDKGCIEIDKFHEVNNKVLDLYAKMKSTIEETVVIPLNTLVKLFNAPSQVIGKRFDKLLDYNHQLGKGGGENEKELKATKSDYEAMNAQLMDELPKFYDITFNLLQHCMSGFVQARRDYMDQSLKESCALLELPSMVSKEHMMEIFKIRHTTAFDHMSMLNFIPRGFNPKVDTVKIDRARQRGKNAAISDGATPQALPQTTPGGQTDSQRTTLYQTYPPEKLYVATTTYNANDLMDISLTEGTIVGIVKELDPMGNKDRWFVDDGATKGFAPSSVLSKTVTVEQDSISPPQQAEEDVLSIHSYDSSTAYDPSLVSKGGERSPITRSYESMPLQTLESSPPQDGQTENGHQFYYALYDFQARHANEASLTAGTPVLVLAFQDSEGNPEWWLVDSDGNRGFAPANYMAPMPCS